MSRLIILIILVCLPAQIANACVYKAMQRSPPKLKFDGPWNDESIKKNFRSCECGQKIPPGQIPPWTLYIHTGSNLCSGTIVTSNLVATSHECVRATGKQLNVYDAWNISEDYKAFEKVADIKVTSTADQGAGESFPVLQLIPNSQFLLSWKTKSVKFGYDSLDLLLIKVQADFTSHPEHSPICIPEDSNNLDFVKQAGYYYTIQSGNPESGNISHEPLEGVIFTKKMCEAAGKTSQDKHDELSGLCFRWINPLGPPPSMHIGGALLIQSRSQHSFLAGLGSSSKSVVHSGEPWLEHAYFSNIIPMIKYLEYRAHQHHSAWCKSPKGGLGLTKSPTTTWPWLKESVQETLKVRNESLDCVCGVPNYEPSGRILGGETANPYEFGWMAQLNTFPFGRDDGRYGICGGAIINNRMILTAAHCVVFGDNKDTAKASSPDAVDVILNSHYRLDPQSISKEVETIIIHPDYVHAVSMITAGEFDYDIVLKEELHFPQLPTEPAKEPGTQNLRPVCLAKIGEAIELHGKQAMVAGWGLTRPGDKQSFASILKKVEVPILPLSECRQVIQGVVSDHFLCSSLLQYEGISQGDSGGPLTIMRGRQWTEVGINSWEQHAAIEGKYQRLAALYTDVTHRDILPFVDFFAKRMEAQWCKSDV